jgi:hypothetical protein
LNQSQRLKRVFHCDAIVGIGGFFCDSHVLPRNDEQAVREINRLYLAQHFQISAINCLELMTRHFCTSM